MRNPPAWNKTLYAQRHRIETLFARLKDAARIALRRDKTRRRSMRFVHLAAPPINLRLAEFSHRAWELCHDRQTEDTVPTARSLLTAAAMHEDKLIPPP